MKTIAIFVTIISFISFLFVPIEMIQAQVQKQTPPGYKIPLKVEKTPEKPTGIQWSAPSKPYVGTTDPVPSGIIKIANFQVELPPGKSFEFDVPLQRGGTMVSVKMVPEGMGPKPILQKISVPLSRSSNIDEAIRPLLEEQLREKQIKVLSMSFSVGNQVFLPIEELSGKYKFHFIVGSQFSSYRAGKMVIKNISNHLFKGTVYASSTDYAGKENFEKQQQQVAIQSAIDNARNPEMLWVLTQTLKRHLRGYPGGRSDYEERFSNTLSEFKVPNETLNAISSHLAVHENRIAQRVVNKSILQIRDAQPIKMEMIRPILKMEMVAPKPEFQAAPKPELNVAEPKVKPGELSAPEPKIPKITVLFPNGGEIWEEGNTYAIRWTSENVQGNVQIQIWFPTTNQVLHTINNVPNTGSYNFKVPKLSDRAEITPYLQISSMDGRARDASDNFFTIIREGARERYTIRLLGVKSHRCADDEDWEWGCDAEEPYVLWTAFGPGYEAYGRTDEGRDIEKNDTWLFSSDAWVFGDEKIIGRTMFGTHIKERSIPKLVASPLIFVYMVIEKDSGSPTKAQIVSAAKSAVATVAAMYSENWGDAVKHGINFISDVIVIFQKIAAKGDDLYPPYLSIFDHSTLLDLTTKKNKDNPPPLNRALDDSVGNFDHVSIQRAFIYDNNRLQWSVFYVITRAQ